MTIISRRLAAALALIGLTIAGMGSASATPVYCAAVSSDANYMSVDDSRVSACLASGVGNLNGNPRNDPFLNSTAGAGFELASKSDDANPFNLRYSQDDFAWMFDASFWDTYSEGAIAFKFGTGDNPDEWFVFSLVPGENSGSFSFFNVFNQGGGLSHMNLYGIRKSVPEPGTLALLGSGLILVGFSRRRRRQVAR